MVDLSIAWYVVPLSAVISLAYSASRYELTERIIHRATRLFITITTCMLVAFAVLWAFSFGL